MTARSLWLMAVLGAAGCSEWPRTAHLDGEEVAVPASQNPRASVPPPAWLETNEVEPNDQPTQTRILQDVEVGDGFKLSGELSGSGWHEAGAPEVLDGADCGSEGSRAPLPAGDYLADVDFFGFSPAEDAVLCASGGVGDDSFGWDMLLFELDACGIPTGVRTNADWPDGLLGFGRGGALLEWSTPVQAGVSYAIMMAAYHPNAPETVLAYQAEFSLQRSAADGLQVLCPLPSFEVQP